MLVCHHCRTRQTKSMSSSCRSSSAQPSVAQPHRWPGLCVWSMFTISRCYQWGSPQPDVITLGSHKPKCLCSQHARHTYTYVQTLKCHPLSPSQGVLWLATWRTWGNLFVWTGVLKVVHDLVGSTGCTLCKFGNSLEVWKQKPGLHWAQFAAVAGEPDTTC